MINLSHTTASLYAPTAQKLRDVRLRCLYSRPDPPLPAVLISGGRCWVGE